MNDEIDPMTYKKWMRKYSSERVRLKDEIDYLKEDIEEQVNQELELLPNLFRYAGRF